MKNINEIFILFYFIFNLVFIKSLFFQLSVI